MQKYWNTVQDRDGNAIQYPRVTVKQGGVNATIYTDAAGLIAATNPLQGDASGYFEFFAAPGTYDLTISGASFATVTITAGAVVGQSAADVTTVQSGTGFIARALSAKIQGGLPISIEDAGGGPSASAATNDTAIAACITALGTTGGEIMFESASDYVFSSTITFRDKSHFILRGKSTQGSSTAARGTRVKWNGSASGTVFLLDACRDFVIEGIEVASGTADYGVGFDWDKISGTGVGTNGTWIRSVCYVPSAGIGWRVSNIADGNHEAGKWLYCYANGPGTATASGLSAGTAGTSIGVQVRGMNAHALLWFGGGTSLLNVTFDINDNIATKNFPSGSLNVIENNGGYCDIYYRVGQYTRWPISISGGTVEFANQLFIGTDANCSEAGVVTIEKLRCAVPTTVVTPFIRYRNQGTLNLFGNNFNNNGYSASFIIKSGVGGGGVDSNIVSIANIYPNATPFDTSAGRIFTLKQIGDKCNDNSGSDAVAMSDFIGGYGGYTSKDFLMTVSLAMSGRLKAAQGAQLTAANNLVLGADGNRFQVAGATQINLIDNSSWQGGAIITLHFQTTPTVKHNQAASGNNKPLMLSGAVDFSATANDQLTLQYDSTDAKWYEIARTVI